MVQSVTDQLFERFSGMQIGELISYADLEAVMGINARRSRASLYPAIRRLQEQCRRTMVCVKNEGYQMADPALHEKKARGHHRKSQRQMKRAVETVESLDRSLLTVEERRRIDRLEMTVKAQQEAIRHLSARADKQEQALDTVREQSTRETGDLAQRVGRMEELLGRLVEQKEAA